MKINNMGILSLLKRQRSIVPRNNLCRVMLMVVAFATSIYFIRTNRQRNDNEETVRRIAYLKTPKTGSSTMTCILRRFAMNHNLAVYTPESNSLAEKDQLGLLAEEREFDIFATHTHYNHFFFTHIIPHPVIIGLVREPVQRTVSSFFYTNYGIRAQREMLDQVRLANYMKDIEQKGITLNVQSQYFGIAQEEYRGNYRLKEHLNKLNKEFLIVLVLERFNESLVLMKRLLKWSFVDILYRQQKANNYEVGFLNSSQYSILKKANQMDIDVYKFFYQELEKKVEAAGDNFKDEVEFFEYVLDVVSAFCNSNPSPQSKYVFKSSRWEGSFSLTAKDCDPIFVYNNTIFKDVYLTNGNI